jgi:hypothetical protein
MTAEERRQQPRLSLRSLRAEVSPVKRFRAFSKRYDCEVENLNRTGLGIITRAPLEPASHVRLSVELPGSGRVELTGTVQYINPEGFDTYRVGILFDAFDDKARHNDRDTYKRICAFEERMALESPAPDH